MSFLDKVLRLFGTSRVQLRWRKELGGRGGSAVPAVVPSDFPLVTAAIGGACLLLYALSLNVSSGMDVETGMTPAGQALVRLGAAFAPFVRAGEWWRTVTAIFLHGDLLHILMNGMGLWIVVAAAEQRFGRARAFVAFVVCGALGEATSSLWYANALSIGASGGIFGLMGLCVVNAMRRRDAELRARFLPWLIYGLIVGFFASGQVDNAAHVGGLAAGALLGLVLGDEGQARRLPGWVWSALTVLVLAAVGGSFALAARSPLYELLQR